MAGAPDCLCVRVCVSADYVCGCLRCTAAAGLLAMPRSRGVCKAQDLEPFTLAKALAAPFDNKRRQTKQGRHVDRLMTVCYLPVCLVFLILTMKLSAWTRLRLLAAYAGFALTIMVVPIVSALCWGLWLAFSLCARVPLSR